MHVHKPIRSGIISWTVRITETRSPLSPTIETLKFYSREIAYQTYRKLKKDAGKGL